MTNVYSFDGIVVFGLLFICTCAYLKKVPRLNSWLLSEKKGVWGVFYKAAVIGTRLHIPVALSCLIMAFYVMFLKWWTRSRALLNCSWAVWVGLLNPSTLIIIVGLLWDMSKKRRVPLPRLEPGGNTPIVRMHYRHEGCVNLPDGFSNWDVLVIVILSFQTCIKLAWPAVPFNETQL